MKIAPAFAAKKLLNQLGIIDMAYVDIKDLIIYHNGMVKEAELKNCDGRLVMKQGRSIVTIDSAIEFEQRKRYVLAHELGHILLHADKEASFTDDDTTLEGYKRGPQEKEANDFAAELLMPTEQFKSSCYKKKFSPELISELAHQFNTSLTSTVYRFAELGNHPIAAFYSKNGKVQYWKKSTDMYYKIPDINKLNVPSNSVAKEFYKYNRIYERKDTTQEITKSTWFELGKYDNDAPMNEFCIITARYNSVLSVIWEA
ncbi:ImmA/IrrE family metallo-endopeptidase [Dyadobacter subterraneus]|uniref:ImmA/IrrE family metallo-endopeptidase n=1 Tax=Dyadobacter subterraneus TaxID=2773304 RepID=A0ABR9WJG7_9BACT|nr:ImmA/IrrE family metallo-endopeptidase [Dyadobacter subterraneus]MBE9465528.1 ImmA/IrrE family metallo-endopeptidase [Dyadobacter subterraneus]